MKTKQEFLEKFNNSLNGWKFTGDNPFSDSNLENLRLRNSLETFSTIITGDKCLIHFNDYFKDLN